MTTTDSAAMKPCPFCGKEASSIYEGFRHTYPYTIVHSGCPAACGVTFASREELVSWWNTRIPASPARGGEDRVDDGGRVVTMPEVRWCYDNNDQMFEYCNPDEVRAALSAALEGAGGKIFYIFKNPVNGLLATADFDIVPNPDS